MTEVAIVAAAVVFAAAAFQALTGFGFALLSTAALLLLFDPKRAVATLAAPSLVTALLGFLRWRRDFVWAPVRGYLAFMAVGLAAGIWAFDLMPARLVRIAMAALLLQTLLGARALPLLRPLQWASVSGLIGGVAAGGIGAPGPAVVSWAHARDWHFATKRATTLGIFAIVEAVRFPAYLALGVLHGREQLALVAWLSVAAAAGVVAGGRLSRHVGEARLVSFMKLALAGLFVVTLKAALDP